MAGHLVVGRAHYAAMYLIAFAFAVSRHLRLLSMLRVRFPRRTFLDGVLEQQMGM